MKALRSSPFRALALGSALQLFILSCCVTGLAERHSFMKALRSSPFLSPASLLQVVILLCWAVGALSCACAKPMQRQALAATIERSFFMVCASLLRVVKAARDWATIVNDCGRAADDRHLQGTPGFAPGK